jgi:putative transposase
MLIEPGHPELSIVRQCELIGLPRASLYYQPCEELLHNLRLMRLLDEQYTKMPYYGVRRMVAHLRRLGYRVGPKRIRRLLRLMGLEAVYPKPHLSQPNDQHRRYPYLLRGVTVGRPDQVWATDITFIRLQHGFAYLVAIMDWHSRYVLSWDLSITLEAEFCLAALAQALRQGRQIPEIFNSDQGAQFTSQEFAGRLEEAGIKVSRDGRGRMLDNIFVERLWRSLKYEEIYLHDYPDVAAAREGIRRYFLKYNEERLHEALGYRTPAEVYLDRKKEAA